MVMVDFGISLAVGILVLMILIGIVVFIHRFRLLDHLEGFVVSVFLSAVAIGMCWAVGQIARSIWNVVK
jgi:cytochrome bd-type quinol oxidase subunit 1